MHLFEKNVTVHLFYFVQFEYRKTGNFRVVQFSRNFAVSINPRKLKSAKYFPIFEKISVEELVAYTVAICGSYLFTCGKTSNMQLSKNCHYKPFDWRLIEA